MVVLVAWFVSGCGTCRRDRLADAQKAVDTVARARATTTGQDVFAASHDFTTRRKAHIDAAKGGPGAVPARSPTPLTPEEREALDQAYQSMVQGCDAVMTAHTQDAATYRYAAIGMAVLGAITGGLVPVLTTASAAGNAEWIAGLGAVSGATNGLQITMGNVGVSYEGEWQTRQAFLTDWKANLDKYEAQRLQQNYDGAIIALSEAVTTCTIYRTALNSMTAVSPFTTPTSPPSTLSLPADDSGAE